jgi:hypothetical protein
LKNPAAGAWNRLLICIFNFNANNAKRQEKSDEAVSVKQSSLFIQAKEAVRSSARILARYGIPFCFSGTKSPMLVLMKF